MSGNVEYLGLCSTCNNAARCRLPKGLGRPVLDCEEFDVEGRPPIETPGEVRPRPSGPCVTEKKDSADFLGLCSNCENREACTLPRSEGGAWHCEEYL